MDAALLERLKAQGVALQSAINSTCSRWPAVGENSALAVKYSNVLNRAKGVFCNVSHCAQAVSDLSTFTQRLLNMSAAAAVEQLFGDSRETQLGLNGLMMCTITAIDDVLDEMRRLNLELDKQEVKNGEGKQKQAA